MEDWARALFELPGETYLSVLAKIHEALHPKRYLEIGVQNGASLSLALEGSYAVGVDPDPKITAPLKAWTQLHKMTSHAFFETYSGPPFDLIFIDGLHRYEAVAEDFCNAEKLCTATSIIMLHDTIPLSAETSTPLCQTSFWTGDVWKIVPAIIRSRPDLTLFTIPCPPSGLTIIKGFGSAKGLSASVVREFQNKQFAWVAGQKKAALKIIENHSSQWLQELF
jgi:hypothetical protein